MASLVTMHGQTRILTSIGTLVAFLVVWVGAAMVWYLFYGFKHSHLGRPEAVGLADEPNP